MSARTFSLAGLLRLRGIEQDQASAVLSAANGRSRAIHARTNAARLELEDCDVDVSSTKALHMASLARASSRSMLADLMALDTVQAAETAAAQAAFLAARGRTVGLEKLELKHDARVTAEDLATEQTALDEISAGAHHRSKEAAKAL
ncbi:MAG TPA: flagellar export protein FliJ [Arthrobacter sp.]